MSSIYSVERFFKNNGLDWSIEIEKELCRIGVECVEHIKLVSSDEWDSLFTNSSIVIKRLATKVYNDHLKGGEINPQKCAIELGINNAASASKTPQPKVSAGKGKFKDDGSSKKLSQFYTVEFTTAKENKRRRLDRKQEAEDAIAEVVNEASIGSPVGNSGNSSTAASSSTAAAAAARGVRNDISGEEEGGGDDDDIVLDPVSDAGRVLLALPPSDWRAVRCELSKDLEDLATDEERLTWDSDIMPESKRYEDLEDPDGYYNIFGCGKTTSDEEVAKEVKRMKKKYQSKIRKYHEDKLPRNISKEDKETAKNKYRLAHSKYKLVVRAAEEIATPNAEGHFPTRVAYDKKGESLRKEMVEAIDTVYNLSVNDRAKQIRERLERDGIYGKRAASVKMNASLPILSKISKSYKRAGQQSVGLKVLMSKAFKLKYVNADIALEIRRFTFRGTYFDESKRTKDKTYQNIMKKVGKYRKEFMDGKLDQVLQLEGKEKRKAMKSKTLTINARGRKPCDELSQMETGVKTWLRGCYATDKRVSRTMIFRQALLLDPSFKGGPKSEGFIERMKNWFYYGFKVRANLSVRKLASVGQKLPLEWETVLARLTQNVRDIQNPQQRGDGSMRIEGVSDRFLINTDHVPFNHETVGNYTWGQKDSGRRNAKTGGKEKDRFTVQLSIGKGGLKLPIFIIWKAAPVASGKKCGNRASVTYEIKNRLPDKDGNPYPTRAQCYMTVNKTANSNKELTKLILKKVILPGAGVTFLPGTGFTSPGTTPGHRVGVIWDEFKAHSCPEVKSYCQSHDFLDVIIIPGGLTPVAQPLDKVINKVLKGYFRDMYDQYILTAPVDKNGAPKPPSRQLLATWVVKCWDMISPELVRKAWTACGYPSEEHLVGDNANAIVVADNVEIGTMIERLLGPVARAHFDDPENEAEDFSTTIGDDDEEDEVEEVFNDDDADAEVEEEEEEEEVEEVFNSSGNNEESVGCAAGALCNMKTTSIGHKVEHQCLNCQKHLHGVLCGALWAEKEDSPFDCSKVDTNLFTVDGRNKMKSKGALICAKCIKACSK